MEKLSKLCDLSTLITHGTVITAGLRTNLLKRKPGGVCSEIFPLVSSPQFVLGAGEGSGCVRKQVGAGTLLAGVVDSD